MGTGPGLCRIVDMDFRESRLLRGWVNERREEGPGSQRSTHVVMPVR
jgi:hypothetical protein